MDNVDFILNARLTLDEAVLCSVQVADEAVQRVLNIAQSSTAIIWRQVNMVQWSVLYR